MAVERNGVQSRKFDDNHNPFSGCLGRMVNLFDINAGVTGKKLLTDKPHRDASTLSRNRSDVTRMKSPPYIDDNKVVSDVARGSSNKKLNESTPIKMLIDQEMTKEVCSTHKPPTLVAKLMGLDTFPGSQPATSVLRSYSSDFSGQHVQSRTPPQCWQQSNGFVERGTLLDKIYQFADHENCKSISETWQKSSKTGNAMNKSPLRGRYNRDVNKKQIDIVRQKFVEAKRLSTDEKLRQSKEFKDALEVLSSNQDLLLEIFQESNPMLYRSLFELQSTGHPETKRITVLRPTKMADHVKFSASRKFEHIQEVEHACSAVVWDKNELRYSSTNQKVDECPVQPTRIVVLKPSPGKASDFKAVTSPTPSLPRILPTKDCFEKPGENGKLQSQRAKVMSKKMPENLAGSQHNENLNSMFSNGYNGDESSFYKSENEYPVGNLSDLEVMSLSPRHSWDYVNRCGSPYSSSSFSRASCSPESSVCREAKKRLSERWAMMASNEHCQEQKHGHRSSSTLGEMLALTDVKKPIIFENGGTGKGQGPRGLISCSSSNFNEGGCPEILSRSKSLPVSSNTCRFDGEVSGIEVARAQASKKVVKSKNIKSSLKGKVSSLFFYRNKRSNQEKASVTQPNDECQLGVETAASPANSHGILSNEASRDFADSGLKESSVTRNLLSARNSPDLTHQQGIIPREQPGLSVSRPAMPVLSENLDQPSPVSVLDPPFEEDESTTQDCTAAINHDQLGPSTRHKSNLIDKSPPIESIARTLSWDDSHTEVATPYTVRPSIAPPDIREEEEDWLSCIHALLSTVGLDDQIQSDSFSYRWHSPESALDPSLRDSYASLNGKELLHEGKRRQKRSNLKLVFDCVNNALEEITGYGSEKHPTGRTYCWGHNVLSKGTTPTLVELIVGHMEELLSSELSCGNSHSLVVDKVVRKEVVGRRWVDLMRLDLDNFGKEIEGKLLEEVVEEVVVYFTDRA